MFKLPSDTTHDILFLIIGVTIPYVGRAIGNYILTRIRNCIFGGNPMTEALLSSVNTQNRPDIQKLSMDWISNYCCELTWNEAVSILGWSQCMAYCVCFIRLVFWHWMQPFM